MADEKTQPSEEQKPSEEMIVRNDAPLKVIRGPKGTFCKQKTTMPKTQDVTRLLRNLMAQAEAGPDGKMRHGDKTRLRRAFDNIIAIATMPAEQPVTDKFGNLMLTEDGRVATFKDAKSAMASVQAFKEVMARVYGQYFKSDEELDALKTQGVKVVILQQAPAEMMNKTIKEDKPQPPPTPAFAEVTEITNDK